MKRDQHRIITSTNGAAERMAAVCKPSRPPTRRRIAAAAPVSTPPYDDYPRSGVYVAP